MKRVLLVEDDNDIRDALRTALKVEGYDVTAFENSQEAWNFLDDPSYKDQFVLLLDLMTPVLSGWEFLGKVRKESPKWSAENPIFVFSAATVTPEMDLSPALKVIHKPVDLGELIDILEKQMELQNIEKFSGRDLL